MSKRLRSSSRERDPNTTTTSDEPSKIPRTSRPLTPRRMLPNATMQPVGSELFKKNTDQRDENETSLVARICQNLRIHVANAYPSVTAVQYWQSVRDNDWLRLDGLNLTVAEQVVVGELEGKTLLKRARVDLRGVDDSEDDSEDEVLGNDNTDDENDEDDELSTIIAIRRATDPTHHCIFLAQLGNLAYPGPRQILSNGRSISLLCPAGLMLAAEVDAKGRFLCFWIVSTRRVSSRRCAQQDHFQIPIDTGVELPTGTGQTARSSFTMAKIGVLPSLANATDVGPLIATEVFTGEIEIYSVRRVDDQLEAITSG